MADLVKWGLQAYDSLNDRAKLPTNKRVFLESMLDENRSAITEQTLRDTELEVLKQLVHNRYNSTN